jgi:hypothetical protein
VPLWDLVYLLADGLALVDRVSTVDPGPRADHFRRLLRGELETSPLLFEAIRATAAASALPAEGVAPAIELWLLDVELNVEPALAEAWAADAALGVGWSAWRT